MKPRRKGKGRRRKKMGTERILKLRMRDNREEKKRCQHLFHKLNGAACMLLWTFSRKQNNTCYTCKRQPFYVKAPG